MKMPSSQYFIVDKRIVPDYYEKVVRARTLLHSGTVREVSEAVRTVGISRSTYYKYKDRIFEPSQSTSGKKAVISLMLDHAPGILSEILTLFSISGANILTINQTLPIHGQANVVLSFDATCLSESVEQLLTRLALVKGAGNVSLVAIE